MSGPHPILDGVIFPSLTWTLWSEHTQRASLLWPRTTSRFPAISGPSKIKPLAQVGTGTPRSKRCLKVTWGSLCHICNKSALWFLLSVSFWCLWVSTYALGEKLYNLNLSTNLSVKWCRILGGTTILKNPTLPHCGAASGFQTASFHPFSGTYFLLLNKALAT